MSEGSDHDYVARTQQQQPQQNAENDANNDEEDETQSTTSSESMPAVVHRRDNTDAIPIQAASNIDHDYVEAASTSSSQPLPQPQPQSQALAQPRRRSVVVLPGDDDDDDEDDDYDYNADEDYSALDIDENGSYLYTRGDARLIRHRRVLLRRIFQFNSYPVQRGRVVLTTIATTAATPTPALNTSSGTAATSAAAAAGNSDNAVDAQPVEILNLVGTPIMTTTTTTAETTATAAAAVMPTPMPTPTTAVIDVDAPPIVSSAQVPDIIEISDSVGTPSPPNAKRKRQSMLGDKATTPKVGSDAALSGNDDEDDGLTCPICLDHWEMSGEHRLVSLRCGHLFGDSCIRRWMSESMRQSAVRVCPQCKTKAAMKDIRFLYARRLRAIDRTEEHRLRKELDDEKMTTRNLTAELATVKMHHQMAAMKIQTLETDNERLRLLMRHGTPRGAFTEDIAGVDGKNANLPNYRLYMEKNFEITREAGCRVMLYSAQHSSLIASQKSAQNLFPGYGVRFIDSVSFRPLTFLHTSGKLVRDICLSADQQNLVVTSLETRCKLFDLRTRQMSAVFSPADKPIWSCAMDRNERENFLYLGNQSGTIFVYDMRYPESIVSEFQTDGDFSPVIHIAPVPAGKTFVGGGFLVCKLMSLWFYEYTNDTAVPTRLNIEGPFLSMSYDIAQETLLLSARSNHAHPKSRFILGKLDKIDGTPVFDIRCTFFGSQATPIMTRAAQIPVPSNTLVVGYLQDCKQLIMFDVRRGERVQTMPVNETVYDTCPIYLGSNTYMAALTDNKCRIYKVNSSTMVT